MNKRNDVVEKSLAALGEGENLHEWAALKRTVGKAVASAGRKVKGAGNRMAGEANSSVLKRIRTDIEKWKSRTVTYKCERTGKRVTTTKGSLLSSDDTAGNQGSPRVREHRKAKAEYQQMQSRLKAAQEKASSNK